MEFEIHFARGGSAPRFAVYHVHTGCYAAWELERNRPDTQSRLDHAQSINSLPVA